MGFFSSKNAFLSSGKEPLLRAFPDDLKFRKAKADGDNERVENLDEKYPDGIKQTRLQKIFPYEGL